MQNYFDNGYNTFLNIDSLTLALGKGFGNDTINSSNFDAFIEEDALPPPVESGGSDTGWNVRLNAGYFEVRYNTTVRAYFGGTGGTFDDALLSVYQGNIEQINTSSIAGNQADNLSIQNGGATGGLTVFIDAQGLDPYSTEVGLGYNNPWAFLYLANNQGSVYTPNGGVNEGLIQYYNDLAGTTQFQGYMNGGNYSFDMTAL